MRNRTIEFGRLVVWIFLALASSTAAATPATGECSGAFFRYLEGTEVHEVNCVAAFGGTSTCGLADCLGPGCVGYDCVGTLGAPCGIGAGGCNVSDSLGCIEGYCAASTACDPETFARSCDGDVLNLCEYSVARLDCAAGGRPYSCGARADGVVMCLGEEGARCDEARGYECASDLLCVDFVCTSAAAMAAGCAAVGDYGACVGDVARRCRHGQLVETDCAAVFGARATCGLLDCAEGDCAGHFCVARQGESCADLPCDVAAGLACVDGMCQAAPLCDPITSVGGCEGNHLSFCAYTLNRVDCDVGGLALYTCDAGVASQSACVGLFGAACSPALGVGCGPGLDCVDDACVPGVPGHDGGGADGGSDGGADGGSPGGGDSGGDADLNAADGTAGDVGPGGADGGDDAAGPTDGSDSDAGGLPVDDSDEQQAAGCAGGCSTTGSGGAILPIFVLAAALLARRRRRFGAATGVLVGLALFAGTARAAEPSARAEAWAYAAPSVSFPFNLDDYPATARQAAIEAGVPVADLPVIELQASDLKQATKDDSGAIGDTVVYTSIPPGFRVGTRGAGPCVGVVITGDNGTVVVGHYANHDAWRALNSLLPNVCLTNPRAYVFSEDSGYDELQKRETAFVAARAISYLKLAGLNPRGFLTSDNLYANAKGQVFHGPVRAQPIADSSIVPSSWGIEHRWKSPPGLFGAPRRVGDLTGCGIVGTVTAQCPGADTAVPFANEFVNVVGIDPECLYSKRALTTPAGQIALATPAAGELDGCTQLQIKASLGETIAQSPPFDATPVSGTITLGPWSLEGVKTGPQGRVIYTGGAGVSGAEVTWNRNEALTESDGVFQFPSRWSRCEVQVAARDSGGAQGSSATVSVVVGGATQVGNIGLCAPGSEYTPTYCEAWDECSTQPCCGDPACDAYCGDGADFCRETSQCIAEGSCCGHAACWVETCWTTYPYDPQCCADNVDSLAGARDCSIDTCVAEGNPEECCVGTAYGETTLEDCLNCTYPSYYWDITDSEPPYPENVGDPICDYWSFACDGEAPAWPSGTMDTCDEGLLGFVGWSRWEDGVDHVCGCTEWTCEQRCY